MPRIRTHFKRESRCGYKKNVFAFNDIHSISGSHADTRETSLLDIANPLSRLTRALDLAKQATLKISFKTRDTWPLKNVLAEFEPADIEKFLAFADQNLPAVSVSVAEVAAHSLSTSQIE